MVKLLNRDLEIVAEGIDSREAGVVEIKWDAPRHAQYNLEITAMRTGNYAVVVDTIDPVDDHGHDFSSATSVDIDETAQGRINWLRDVDYFKFDAESGFEYEVVVQIDGTPVEIRAFDSDGSPSRNSRS